MPISSLKYAGRYNAYDLAANEVLWQERSFPCGDYEKIITQAQVIRTAGATSGRLLTKWLDASNRTMAVQETTIPVTNRWGRFFVVFDVPVNAVACIQAIDGMSAGFTFACAMTDVGETLRAFSYDLTGMTSYLGPDGLYNGTVFANQVIILDANGNVAGTLDAQLFTMSAGINTAQTEAQKAVQKNVTYAGVKISPLDGFVNIAVIANKTLEVKINATDGIIFRYDGRIIGGIEVVDGRAITLASRLLNPDNRRLWWDVGEEGTGTGIRAALEGWMQLHDAVTQELLPPQWFMRILANTIITSINVPPRVNLTADDKGVTAFELTNGSAKIRISEYLKLITLTTNFGQLGITEIDAYIAFGSGTTRRTLGADASGFYKRIGTGTKTYF